MTRLRSAAAAGALLFAAGLAGVAYAGPIAPVKIDLGKVAQPSTETPALPIGYAPPSKPLPESIAKTSVDHRFAAGGEEDYTGAAGLLCGLKPGDDSPGAAAAFGRDRDGKFVGAKFTIAF